MAVEQTRTSCSGADHSCRSLAHNAIARNLLSYSVVESCYSKPFGQLFLSKMHSSNFERRVHGGPDDRHIYSDEQNEDKALGKA